MVKDIIKEKTAKVNCCLLGRKLLALGDKKVDNSRNKREKENKKIEEMTEAEKLDAMLSEGEL